MEVFNIVLIVVDALRPSNMEIYGYDLPTTPNLSTHLRHTILFENAYCCATNTDPSLTAIFTGKYPSTTGVRNHGARTTQDEVKKAVKLWYLSEILRDNGYSTAAVDVSDRWHRKGFDEYLYQTKSNLYGLGSVGNQVIDRLHAYDLFFAIVSRLVPPTSLPTANLRAEDATNSAIRLISKWRRNRNFMFVHYWDTHTPYAPPRKLIEKFYAPRDLGTLKGLTPKDIIRSFKRPLLRPIDVAWIRKLPSIEYALAAYDGAVAHVDREIGRLLQHIYQSSHSDRTVVIITSDHGESLLEHGVFFDHHSLYESVVKVPLIVIPPESLRLHLPKRIKTPVSHVDLAPSILEISGIPFNEDDFDGRSLFSTLGRSNRFRPILMEENHFERKRAVRIGRYKLIYALGGGSLNCKFCGRPHGDRVELFDLELDPYEQSNLVSKESDVAQALSAAFVA